MSEVKYYHDTKQLHHGERGNDDEESIQILLDHRDKKVLVLLAKRTERLISDFQEVKHGLKIGEMCCSKSPLPRTSIMPRRLLDGLLAINLFLMI